MILMAFIARPAREIRNGLAVDRVELPMIVPTFSLSMITGTGSGTGGKTRSSQQLHISGHCLARLTKIDKMLDNQITLYKIT